MRLVRIWRTRVLAQCRTAGRALQAWRGLKRARVWYRSMLLPSVIIASSFMRPWLFGHLNVVAKSFDVGRSTQSACTRLRRRSPPPFVKATKRSTGVVVRADKRRSWLQRVRAACWLTAVIARSGNCCGRARATDARARLNPVRAHRLESRRESSRCLGLRSAWCRSGACACQTKASRPRSSLPSIRASRASNPRRV
jgi:hypothetical protein